MTSHVSVGGANRATMRALLVIGRRLLIVVAALALSTAVAYLLRDLLLRGLLAHTGFEGPLPARGRSESLLMALRASYIVAAAVSMPVILYQGTRCFLPVVQAHQKGSVVLLVALGSLFFLLGEAIAVLLLIPFSPQLVWDLVPGYVDTWPRYVALVSHWTLATGAICASLPVWSFWRGCASFGRGACCTSESRPGAPPFVLTLRRGRICYSLPFGYFRSGDWVCCWPSWAGGWPSDWIACWLWSIPIVETKFV